MKLCYKGNKTYRRNIGIGYLILVNCLVAMIIINHLSFGEKKTNYGLGQFEMLKSGWVDENGKPFYFTGSSSKTQKIEKMTVYYKIPTDLENEESIVFRTKSTSVRVWIGEDLVYETDIKEGPFNNFSPGIRWNVVTYHKQDAGKIMTMEVTAAYLDGSCKVDNMYRGERTAIIIELIRSKALALLTCLLMIAVSIVYYFTGIILNYKQKEKDYSLIYLATFSILVAIWCLVETNVLQLFVNNIRLLQTICNIAQMMAGVPFFLYMDCMYNTFRYKIVKVMCTLNILYVAGTIVLHMMGIYDINMLLDNLIIGYTIAMPVFFIYGIKYRKGYRQYKRNAQKERSYCVKLVGIFIISACVMIDFYYYRNTNVLDYARYTRMGLLVFILLFGYDNILHLVNLVKQGLKTDLISSLAYTDGLTKVGNRTAYMEEIENIAKKMQGESCGIIIFDINDLKIVNDQQGHAAGDRLIKRCANIIQESFGPIGKVYRVGGDEFAVIIRGCNVVHIYEHAIGDFKKRMVHGEGVCIAYGAAYCNEITEENLHETEKEADKNMYQNKYSVKMKSVDVKKPNS